MGDVKPRGTRGIRLAIAAFILSIILFVGVIAAGLYLRSETSQENCEATRQNNQIFREFAQHSKERNIAVVRDGEIGNITIPEIRAFYNPILARIDAVHC